MAVNEGQIFFSVKNGKMLLSLSTMIDGNEIHLKLFKNDYHKPGDKQPCMKGTVQFAGKENEIAIWAPKEGMKNYSGRIKPKDQEAQPAQPNQPEQPKPEPPKPAPAPEPVNRRSLLR